MGHPAVRLLCADLVPLATQSVDAVAAIQSAASGQALGQVVTLGIDRVLQVNHQLPLGLREEAAVRHGKATTWNMWQLVALLECCGILQSDE